MWLQDTMVIEKNFKVKKQGVQKKYNTIAVLISELRKFNRIDNFGLVPVPTAPFLALAPAEGANSTPLFTPEERIKALAKSKVHQ